MTTVSELSPRRRRRRSEASRSIAAILEAAIKVLGDQPQASVDEIASAAGVSRQTVYAHFASREGLLKAVLERVTEEAVAAIDAADIEKGPATEALLRLIEASWRTFERYPLVLNTELAVEDGADLHQPVIERLNRLIERGQATGDFDRDCSPAWLLAVAMALGHAAGAEVGAGRMRVNEAEASYKQSVLRAFGAATGPGQYER